MELYTWEYEGKQEVGYCDITENKDALIIHLANWRLDRYFDKITNFRPVKVVDKDAVVIDEATLRDIKGLINEAKSYGEGDLWGIAKRISLP